MCICVEMAKYTVTDHSVFPNTTKESQQKRNLSSEESKC